jgi:hypothetical protein
MRRILLTALLLAAVPGSTSAGPLSAAAKNEVSPCEKIEDPIQQANCIVKEKTKPGGGVRAMQPGVLAKPE